MRWRPPMIELIWWSATWRRQHFPCALVVIITGVLVASGSLELFFLVLLLRFLLEVVHLALGACLSTCIPTSPSLCSLSSSHPSPPPQAWPWRRTTPVRIDSIRQRGGHSSLVASKAACAHQKAWSFSLEPRSSQQGLGQMRDGDTGMLVDKGLASWTRACRDGQGLVSMDKGLSRWTRACLEMD